MKKSTFLFILMLMMFMACNLNQSHIQSVTPTPYELMDNWVYFDAYPSKQVDVFYVYPTIFNSDTMLNMDIHSDTLRNSALISTNKQIGVYADTCNLYAPYYQQMSMVGLTDSTLNTDSLIAIAFNDVKNAFAYYLSQSSRPFILAGHSQGSEMLLILLKDSFFTNDVRKRMIAAYLIGYSVTAEESAAYPNRLKIAQRHDDTGVVITYNSQGQPDLGSPVLLPGAQCVNPLLWTSSDSVADAGMNLGAVFFDDHGNVESEIDNFTGAYIDLSTGALIVTSPDAYNYPVGSFPDGVFHKYDYSFFYNNLKSNVNDRVGKVLKPE